MIKTHNLSEISVARLSRMRDVIDFDPPYQREGEVWKNEARMLLIDSIVNGLEIPKIYFESLQTNAIGPTGLRVRYAVLDGKQRLETILAYLDDDLALPSSFIYFDDETLGAAGLKFSELSRRFPLLAQAFLHYELPIVEVRSDNGDLIEEMFQRLNAATSLNAAERRNAVAGPTRDATNTLAAHHLLVEMSPLSSARYRYRELASKFLAIEHQMETKGKIADTKALTLLNLFRHSAPPEPKIAKDLILKYETQVSATLDRMASIFEPSDRLLASVGTVVVYYILFRDPALGTEVTRTSLQEFERQRRFPDDSASDDSSEMLQLREYNSLVQSTNDGSALTRRAEILAHFVSGFSESDILRGLRDQPSR